MQDKPLLSIIVPVYNIKTYLPECIDSILNQNYRNFELILVDDGSTDGSGEICNAYEKEDQRIRVIHKENGGLVTARKAGLAVARGEFIANIDGDDWIEPQMMSVLTDTILEDGVDFVQSGYCNENRGQKTEYCYAEQRRKPIQNRSRMIREWMNAKTENGIDSQIVTKLYKAALFKSVYLKVPDDMSNGEDYVSFLELIDSASSYSSLNRIFYHYRIREDSLSHSFNIHRMINENYLSLYAWRRMNRLFPEIPLSELNRWVYTRLASFSGEILLNDFSDMVYFHRYRFPDISTLFDKRIVIYGAGAVGREYYLQVSRYQRIEIAGWLDKGYPDVNSPYMEIEPPEKIRDLSYDFVLVAVLKEKIFKDILQELIELRVPENKIRMVLTEKMI